MKQVDNTSRRKWDVAEYEARAKQREQKNRETRHLSFHERRLEERDPLKRGLIDQRGALKKVGDGRRVDYEAQVGKTQVVSLIGDKSKQGGFYCELCDRVYKDSLAFADHLNGPQHQRMLGMTMKTERVGVAAVKGKLDALKRKREQDKTRDPDAEYEERIAKRMNEEEELRQRRKQKKLEKKARANEEAAKADEQGGDVDEDMMAAMGFGGFGTSKQ